MHEWARLRQRDRSVARKLIRTEFFTITERSGGARDGGERNEWRGRGGGGEGLGGSGAARWRLSFEKIRVRGHFYCCGYFYRRCLSTSATTTTRCRSTGGEVHRWVGAQGALCAVFSSI